MKISFFPLRIYFADPKKCQHGWEEIKQRPVEVYVRLSNDSCVNAVSAGVIHTKDICILCGQERLTKIFISWKHGGVCSISPRHFPDELDNIYDLFGKPAKPYFFKKLGINPAIRFKLTGDKI
jgi:hypothetical protein